METSKLRKFAAFARKLLIEQVGTKLKAVLAEGSLARRENAKAIADLEAKIADVGKQQTIETIAYTWFNRFCALRYMDINRYTKIGILSPAEGQFLPEILAEAKQGHIDEEIVPTATRERVMRILDGTDPSGDPQGEAYRLLLVAACNHYHSIMPFMFERISDYTELLLPDDLLSGSAIPTYTREALLPANCSPEHTEESVEVIGWLYQFYIADKKDDVFAALKKGKKITPVNIPAATQLFTPHWIVRYLVENSLGRLWMLNHPESQLAERMDYYIKPEEPETDFLKIASAEEIKICDPACGSGHMLTYAFDLLYAIYEEQGYQATEIPRLILTHNLYGIEIDHRAGALAAFALTMKAREKDKRFFTRIRKITQDALVTRQSPIVTPLQPNICVLENIKVDPQELDDYMDKVGRDLFSGGLQGVVNQWEQADNFGSLIRPLVTDVSEVLKLLLERQMGENLFLARVHQKVLKALRQADYLSPKYQVVVANPPYMGGRGMNGELGTFAREFYPISKSDLFSAFIERCIELAAVGAFNALVTMESWMFLSSFETLRTTMLGCLTLLRMCHMPYLGRGGTSMGISFGTTAFVTRKKVDPRYKGHYCCVRYYETDDNGVPLDFPPKNERLSRASTNDFEKIPGRPIAYWVSEAVLDAFVAGTPLEDVAPTRKGMVTARNHMYVRDWHEVSINKSGLDKYENREHAKNSGKKWFSYLKGGGFRKWYGNRFDVVDWKNDGHALQTIMHPSESRVWATNFNLEYIFRANVNWGAVTSAEFSARISEGGELFDAGGSACFPSNIEPEIIVAFLNSKITGALLSALNPTLNFQAGNISNLPILNDLPRESIVAKTRLCIKYAKGDWNSFETSWDFASQPLLSSKDRECTLSETYKRLSQCWRLIVDEVQQLESEINSILIRTYGMCDELSSEVAINRISLGCNPAFRYEDKSESELSGVLLTDTMREFISYAVGCMLGRYSLVKPGLILANQGDSLREYFQLTILDSGLEGEYDDSRFEECMNACRFAPDEDNVIPILDGDWFTDDISERFKEFLKVTFGTNHYAQNLKFLEDALHPENATGRKRKTIRDYFLKDFYNHHIKLYRNRPIYWLFSSPKGTFNALIYMHRYRPDTVSTVLQYLRDFRDKLAHRAEHQQMVADSAGSTTAEKAKALKEVTAIKKQVKELEDYERETMFPLAQAKLEMDLDDGVKHNYPRFGNALKKIPGLAAKED